MDAFLTVTLMTSSLALVAPVLVASSVRSFALNPPHRQSVVERNERCDASRSSVSS